MNQKKPCPLCVAQARAIPLLPNRAAWNGSFLEKVVKDFQAEELAQDMICTHKEQER